MSERRNHYELAFEAHLNRRGTAYVAVEDVRHFTRGKLGAKSFDYIVYPAGGPACLVDLKGRKSPLRDGSGDCRKKNWVTRGDIDGLLAWQQVFGPEYRAVFVFGYWLAEGPQARPSPEDAGVDEVLFAGRRYHFWLVPVAEYARHHKRLSKSWDTVSVPIETFRGLTKRLEACWPAAPC